MLCSIKSCFGKKQEPWFVLDRNPSILGAAVDNRDTERSVVKADMQAHPKEK